MTNDLELCGDVLSCPEFSHENHGIPFCRFRLGVKRLSGTEDMLNVLAEERLAAEAEIRPGLTVRVQGELRSYNDKNAAENRLKIHAWAKTLVPWEGGHINIVRLTGTVCKPPIYRMTPYGREITDLILSVPRSYGRKQAAQRADYLPCITWGSTARMCSVLPVRSVLRLEGRLQSRKYRKVLGEESVERTAFEVSVSGAEILENLE